MSKTVTIDIGQIFKEAINEFINSGTEIHKIVSACIKTALTVELALKIILEQICPALLLENQKGDYGLQIAKIFHLENQLLNPRSLESVGVRLAGFGVIMERASKFIDLKKVKRNLKKLADIRNSLVHEMPGEHEIQKINALLARHVLPFLRKLLQTHKLSSNDILEDRRLWREIKSIGTDKEDLLFKELKKKLLHFQSLASKIGKSRLKALLKLKPVLSETAAIVKDNLLCPSCLNQSLAFIVEADFDWNPDGVMEHAFTFMKCRVCELELDQDEKEYIDVYFDKLPNGKKIEKSWSKIPNPLGYDYL